MDDRHRRQSLALLYIGEVPLLTESLLRPFQHNYGEGSAREHASLQPRFLNCKVILAWVLLTLMSRIECSADVYMSCTDGPLRASTGPT